MKLAYLFNFVMFLGVTVAWVAAIWLSAGWFFTGILVTTLGYLGRSLWRYCTTGDM